MVSTEELQEFDEPVVDGFMYHCPGSVRSGLVCHITDRCLPEGEDEWGLEPCFRVAFHDGAEVTAMAYHLTPWYQR